jgi:hypothetical protein
MDRRVLMAAVLVAGLLAGGGVAYLIGQIRPVFVQPRSLGRITGLPVLGVVSLAGTGRNPTARRLTSFFYSVALLVLFVLFVAVVRFNEAGAVMFKQLSGLSGSA